MEHHLRAGFQRTFTNDVYHIEKQLQEYDEHLYIMWNPNTGEHLIMDGLVNLAIMKIPQRGFPELSSAVVEHIRKIHTIRFSATKHVMEADERREREMNRRLEDMAYDFAKEMKEAGINAFDYGITSGRRKYVQVQK